MVNIYCVIQDHQYHGVAGFRRWVLEGIKERGPELMKRRSSSSCVAAGRVRGREVHERKNEE